MANETQKRLTGIVEFVLKDKGLLDLKKRLDDTEKALSRAESRMAGMGQAAQGFALNLAGLISAGALVAFARSGVAEFAELERVFNATAFRMKQLGIEAKDELPKVRAELEQIARTGGPAVVELAKAFQRFVGMTRDVDAALYATKLAADASESGLIDMNQATDAVAKLMQGKAKEAAQSLGIELHGLNGELKDNEQLMREVIAQLEGMGDAFNDAANDLDVLAAEWDEFKRAVGEGVYATREFLPSLGDITKAFKSLGPIAVKTFYEIRAFATAASKAGEAFFDFGPGWAERVKAGWAKGWDAYKHELAGAQEELDKLWEIAGESEGKAEGKGREKALDVARRAGFENDKKAAEGRQRALEAEMKQRNETLRRAREWEQKNTDEMRKLADAQLQRRQQKINADMEAEYQSWVTSLLNAQQLREDAEDQELADLQVLNEQKLERVYALYDDQIAAHKEYLEEKAWLDIQEMALEEEREIARAQARGATEAEIQAIRDRYANAYLRIQTALGRALAKIDLSRKMSAKEAAFATVDFLTAAFPKVKAFAIASALINTYEGVTKALAAYPPPWSFIFAAAQLAAGIAQVNAIRKQKPMAVGGVAVGPTSALIGEAGPEPVIPLNSARANPFYDRVAEQIGARMGSGSAAIVINGGTFVGYPGGMTGLYRGLQRVGQQERARRIGG